MKPCYHFDVNSFQAPKGTFDIFQGAEEPWRDARLWQKIESLCRSLCVLWGFSEIRTPIFENLGLFSRSSGEGSDVVDKEMYEFTDKGGRQMALRPEMTASVVRAILEHRLHAQTPLRYYYIGSCFRYDRPQQGRYRQLHQWGVESIGINDPMEDVQTIALAMRMMQEVDVRDVSLQINSIGSLEDRIAYKEALRQFLKPHFSKLSEDSQKRFDVNPLRILDSKSPDDIAIIAGAPSLTESLSATSKGYFDSVCSNLLGLGITFEINPKLVRGLDYYSDTVFEIVRKTEGRQNSIAGGGRYNGLFKNLSGSVDLPAFGFSVGIERLIQAHLENHPLTELPSLCAPIIAPLCPEARERSLELTQFLRQHNIAVTLWLKNSKLGKVLSAASDMHAPFVILIGQDELDTDSVTVKRLSDGLQKRVSQQQLLAEIMELRRS